MARIAGVNLPTNKRVIIALTYIHGIGRKTAVGIADKLGIDHARRIQDLSDAEILQIRETPDADHTVEGDLRRNTAMNIKRLMDLACYRGDRMSGVEGKRGSVRVEPGGSRISKQKNNIR